MHLVIYFTNLKGRTKNMGQKISCILFAIHLQSLQDRLLLSKHLSFQITLYFNNCLFCLSSGKGFLKP